MDKTVISLRQTAKIVQLATASFPPSDEELITQYVNHYDSLDVQEIINTRLSSFNNFEEKFLRLCDDWISRGLLDVEIDWKAFNTQQTKYVNKVPVPLLQAYINWLKDGNVLNHFHSEALNKQINYLLDRVVYSGCNRETFVQDQIALCISEEKFDDAEILIRHLSDDDTSAKLSSIILLLRSAALDDSQSTSLKAAGLVLCEAIATKDAAFSSLLSNAISSNHAMDAEAIKTARNLDDGALGKILITASAMNSLMETQRETMRASASNFRQSVIIKINHETARKELINTALQVIKDNITEYNNNSTNKARNEMASKILDAITLLKAEHPISQNGIDTLKRIMQENAKKILKEYGNDSNYAAKGGYWGFSKGSALYRTLTQSIGDITALAQELDILAITMDTQLIAAYVTTFNTLNFSDAIQSSDYDRIFYHYQRFDSGQKETITNKIRETFNSLSAQLNPEPGEPVKIDFTLSNIYRLINLSAQLKQPGAEAPLLDSIKEPLSAFFASFNIDAVIEQAFRSPTSENLDYANTLIGLQKISQALNQPEFDGLPSLTSISTTADLVLENQKRKYLDRWATGQCNDESDLLFKTSLKAFEGISSQARLDDKHENFSLTLWSSLQDTTLRHYAFKAWNCLLKDLRDESTNAKKSLEQQLAEGTLNIKGLITIISPFSENKLIGDELANIKLCLSLFDDAPGQVNLKQQAEQQAASLLGKALNAKLTHTDKQKIFLLKEAFFALNKIAMFGQIDVALADDIQAVFSSGKNMRMLSGLFCHDRDLQNIVQHFCTITEVEDNPAGLLSQQMKRILENSEEIQTKINAAFKAFHERSKKAISTLATDNHLSRLTDEDQLKQTTFERCMDKYFFALDKLRRTLDHQVLDQLVTDLETLKADLEAKLNAMSKPSTNFMRELTIMINEVEQSVQAYRRDDLFAKVVEDAPSQAQTVSINHTAYIKSVGQEARNISTKSKTSIEDKVKGWLTANPDANKDIIAAYVLCQWYETTDGGKKNFSDTKRNDPFIKQYENMESCLMSALDSSTQAFPSNIVSPLIIATSKEAKKLDLLESWSGISRVDSSLARLLRVIQNISDTKPYSVSHGGPRDPIASEHSHTTIESQPSSEKSKGNDEIIYTPHH